MSMRFEDHLDSPEGFNILNRRVLNNNSDQETWDIRDLYVMKYMAAEEGVSLEEYLHKQEIHDISLNEALENAKVGRTTRDFLDNRNREFLKQRKWAKVRSVASELWKPLLPIAATLALVALVDRYSPEPKYDSFSEYVQTDGGLYFRFGP